MPYVIPLTNPCDACEGLNGACLSAWVVVKEFRGVTVFMTDRQRSEGSILIVPNRHVTKLADLTDEEAVSIAYVLHIMCEAITQAMDPDGLHIWTGTGRLAGQSLGHMHVQVVPRYNGTNYSFAPSAELPITPLDERIRQADALRHCLRTE